MIPATPADQRRLLDLQAVDTAIRQLRHRRSHLPEQQALDDNVDTLAKVREELVSARDRLAQLEKAQRRHEQEIEQVDARRKSEEGRMYSGQLSSEKEVEAIRSELSSMRARKGDLEDSLLEVMEQREELDSMVASLAEREEELASATPGLVTARDTAATDIDAELEAEAAKREQIAGELPEAVVTHYDELRARKEDVAVAPLQGKTCMGCRLELTAIELEETRETAERGLAKCEQCGRILVPT